MIGDRTLQEMVNLIVEVARPLMVVLFGSYARGGAGELSDVDFLVIQETNLPRPKRGLPLYSALRHYHCSKDILVYTPSEVDEYRALPHSFIMTALREGKVVYER